LGFLFFYRNNREAGDKQFEFVGTPCAQCNYVGCERNDSLHAGRVAK